MRRDQPIGRKEAGAAMVNLALFTDPASQGVTMAAATVGRAQLTEAVYREVRLVRKDCRDIVGRIIDEITSALARGERVTIARFGSFHVRLAGPRVGRNPKTRQEVRIDPSKTVKFRASRILKAKIGS
jgi:integration host factor subunit alpha